jgi:hypothetical protein
VVPKTILSIAIWYTKELDYFSINRTESIIKKDFLFKGIHDKVDKNYT